MGRTSKPLTIIVDEGMFDTLATGLADAGHVVKRLSPIGYNLIIGPKVSNLTLEDVKKNPKLVEVALKRATEMAYPKGKPAKEEKHVVEDPQTLIGEAEKGSAPQDGADNPAPKPAKPRAKRKSVGAGKGKGAKPAADPSPDATTDTTSGGK